MTFAELHVSTRVDQDQLVADGALEDRVQHSVVVALIAAPDPPRWPWSPPPGPATARSWPSAIGHRPTAEERQELSVEVGPVPSPGGQLEVLAGEPHVLHTVRERHLTEPPVQPPTLHNQLLFALRGPSPVYWLVR
jgi:hypothetical protein